MSRRRVLVESLAVVHQQQVVQLRGEAVSLQLVLVQGLSVVYQLHQQ